MMASSTSVMTTNPLFQKKEQFEEKKQQLTDALKEPQYRIYKLPETIGDLEAKNQQAKSECKSLSQSMTILRNETNTIWPKIKAIEADKDKIMAICKARADIRGEACTGNYKTLEFDKQIQNLQDLITGIDQKLSDKMTKWKELNELIEINENLMYNEKKQVINLKNNEDPLIQEIKKVNESLHLLDGEIIRLKMRDEYEEYARLHGIMYNPLDPDELYERCNTNHQSYLLHDINDGLGWFVSDHNHSYLSDDSSDNDSDNDSGYVRRPDYGKPSTFFCTGWYTNSESCKCGTFMSGSWNSHGFNPGDLVQFTIRSNEPYGAPI